MIRVESNNSRSGADVIVVGAGALGCLAAHHLAERGLDVLVLDAASGPALQTTGAAAGFVASFSAVHHHEWEEEEWRMQQYGIGFYTQLAADSPHDFAFAASGIAYVYVTDGGWDAVQSGIEQARGYGSQLEVLTPERTAAVLPQLRSEHTTGILFEPAAVRLRAADAIPALAAATQQRGVRFHFDAPVSTILEEERAVTGVRADAEFRAPRVVIAAGAWSRPLLGRHGAELAAEPRVVARYTTRPLPGIDITLPMLMFSDSGHRFFIREEAGGLLIGGADPQPLPADRFVDADNPPPVADLPHTHARRMREYLLRIEHVMPVLAQAEIDRTDAGLPCYTTDRRFVADAVPGRRGLYALAACNEAGVTHGPALARHLVELMVDGHTQLPRGRFAIDRQFG